MAQKNTKKIFNMAYGLGASIVIIGALFKLTHYSIGFLTGNVMLAIGLITEAIIFAISAFEPVDDDLDWSLVYPELADGRLRDKDKAEAKEAQSLLSQKLDDMLRDAKLDAGLMKSLGESIQNFKGAAENIAPTVDSIAATTKYSEQLSLAAAQMESLNSLYKVQLDSTSRQAEINEQVAVNAGKLKEQMESLATNLSSLNGVYGGMLSAMSNK
ncbi:MULTISPECIES: type IX secretion system motor protein PorL/GldL [Flavobacteriaceae]|uniref:Gliding motility protein GldL n=2 Tax=Flavobacteriaceae TaxID=49546 RepID=A0A4Y8AS35_9FLAO|nr:MULTISPECIES: gliding motility protein GldL [Flavobacteriaceae]TEW73034.1 gliding motility protein GldL [Gramella jeungdoensis]GGK47583.1 gliding motility protein GldL [Lutibacter litoralis]